MIERALLAAIAGFALAPVPAAAQASWLGRLDVEVRGGMSVGTHSESAARLELAPEPSFDLVLKGEVVPTLFVFGGYYQTSFGCEEGFCTGLDLTIVGNHGALGALWAPDLRMALGPWVRAGALVGMTRAGTAGADPDIGAGVDLGAGLQWAFGRVTFLPGVSYRYLMANTPASSAHAVALSGHLGVAVSLGGG